MIVCPYKDLGRYAAIIPGLKEAMEAIDTMTGWNPGVVPLSGGSRILVQEGTTRPQCTTCEAHRQYLDIQYIVRGREVMGWAPLDTLTPTGPFSGEKDVGFYTGDYEFIPVGPGQCYVVFPEDAHLPGRHLEEPSEYVKIVVKLKV